MTNTKTEKVNQAYSSREFGPKAESPNKKSFFENHSRVSVDIRQTVQPTLQGYKAALLCNAGGTAEFCNQCFVLFFRAKFLFYLKEKYL